MTIKQVQRILQEEGPATAKHIRERLGKVQTTVGRQLGYLKAKGLIHVVRWEHQPSGKTGPLTAVYAYGPGTNVAPPPWKRKSEAGLRTDRDRGREKKPMPEAKPVVYKLPPAGIWGGLMR